jgi:hypothetical protein
MSDFRNKGGMNNEATQIIEELGGTSAVAKLIEAPVSTVHSWKTNGIPASRLAHIRLAAQVRALAAGTPPLHSSK